MNSVLGKETSMDTIHIIAPNPDRRRREQLAVTCESFEEVQRHLDQFGIDPERAIFIMGGRIIAPVMKLIPVFEEAPRRRGRPLGSRDKKKRRVTKSTDGTIGALVDAKKVKRRKKLTKQTEIVAESTRGRRAKETQADRNARMEAEA